MCAVTPTVIVQSPGHGSVLRDEPVDAAQDEIVHDLRLGLLLQVGGHSSLVERQPVHLVGNRNSGADEAKMPTLATKAANHGLPDGTLRGRRQQGIRRGAHSKRQKSLTAGLPSPSRISSTRR